MALPSQISRGSPTTLLAGADSPRPSGRLLAPPPGPPVVATVTFTRLAGCAQPSHFPAELTRGTPIPHPPPPPRPLPNRYLPLLAARVVRLTPLSPWERGRGRGPSRRLHAPPQAQDYSRDFNSASSVCHD